MSFINANVSRTFRVLKKTQRHVAEPLLETKLRR